MNKRHLHHFWTRFRAIKPWYFLALFLISSIVYVFALHFNNIHMLKLRAAVFSADQNNTDVQVPLKALQAYVTSHMNTNLNAGKNPVYPPIQLKYTYERLVKGQGDQIAKANAQFYNVAQAYCEQQNSTDVSGRNRVPCIEQYVQEHHTQLQQQIPDALYKFDFVSPKWSPDLAGWSMFVAILSGLLFVITFITHIWFRRYVI